MATLHYSWPWRRAIPRWGLKFFTLLCLSHFENTDTLSILSFVVLALIGDWNGKNLFW